MKDDKIIRRSIQISARNIIEDSVLHQSWISSWEASDQSIRYLVWDEVQIPVENSVQQILIENSSRVVVENLIS
jgi:hypothetical protein